MRKIILILIICSGCHAAKPVKEHKEVKGRDRNHQKFTTGQVFLMVGSFMLGYCITDEYIREK